MINLEEAKKLVKNKVQEHFKKLEEFVMENPKTKELVRITTPILRDGTESCKVIYEDLKNRDLPQEFRDKLDETIHDYIQEYLIETEGYTRCFDLRYWVSPSAFA